MIYFPSNHMIELIKRGDFAQLRQIVKEYKVSSLDFSNKDVDDLTAPMIAKAVMGLNVTCLNMSYNLMGAQGALAMVEQLRGSTVTELDLSRNAIGEAFIEVMRALSSTSIKVVKLAYNRLGSQGVSAVESMSRASNVKVDVSHNLLAG